MDSASVLILHGSPGSGKSTLARAMSELLRAAGVPHGVIDVDELNLIFPSPERDFWLGNLAAVWPRYAAVPGIRMIIPTVVADVDRLELLRAAAPAASFQVCELVAPLEVLKARVTEREPTEEWRASLRAWVDHHAARTDLEDVRDFVVSTCDRTEVDAAEEVLRRAGWSV
ncbi:AAA family ATPase [Microbacterium sp. 179-I 3D3 NHS]|uniref:AAA family ATPase n=1 Tax=Microbacterium sp. 179-I 3D3 NHS TaxID=3142382 RepID=UPI00399F2C16